MLRLSLKVGVKMLFSTENGVRTNEISFGFSKPDSLFSTASLYISSITSFLKAGSERGFSKSSVFRPKTLINLKYYLPFSPAHFFNLSGSGTIIATVTFLSESP